MPLRSNYQTSPGDSFSELGKQTSDEKQSRDLTKEVLCMLMVRKKEK